MARGMAQGTITRYVDDKGFGFIKSDDSEQDVFFHRDAFDGQPREGMTVAFDLQSSDRGPRAINVHAA